MGKFRHCAKYLVSSFKIKFNKNRFGTFSMKCLDILSKFPHVHLSSYKTEKYFWEIYTDDILRAFWIGRAHELKRMLNIFAHVIDSRELTNYNQTFLIHFKIDIIEWIVLRHFCIIYFNILSCVFN